MKEKYFLKQTKADRVHHHYLPYMICWKERILITDMEIYENVQQTDKSKCIFLFRII